VVTAPAPTEYLDEIRKQVCAFCIERPPGGPPCAPLGKQCGIELHLPQLIDAIHEVHSPSIAPYLDHNREKICQKCAFLHSSICPCPMDYLAVLLVQAVEAVDERRERHEQAKRFVTSLPETEEVGLEEIQKAYEDAVGQWRGCDWPTHFGRTGLDLADCTPAEAEALAVDAMGTEEAEDWSAAADWLGRVEGQAKRAEAQAALAVAAANAGEWSDALAWARKTLALEFASGRPVRRGGVFTWGPLYQAIESAANAARRPTVNASNG
jgi:hypothetical protein